MNITLIRHGKTKGNLEHRYIGRTDEPLCEEGIEEIKKIREAAKTELDNLSHKEILHDSNKASVSKAFPDIVFVSPLRRCIQTAEILFEQRKIRVVDAFREYDFGDFEGKNHEELMENESYRKWLESNGAYDMPAGEGLCNFKKRVTEAFECTINECLEKDYENIVYVVHGGTIMAICEKYDSERKSYYDYMCKNGDCYKAVWTGSMLKQMN